MSFLKKVFKKKPGGTFLGNALRMGASSLSGGLLGSGLNRIDPGQTMTNAQLQQTVFAGQSASTDGKTININEPLQEVTVSATRLKKEFDGDNSPVIKKLGDLLSYGGKRFSENTEFGVDKTTLVVLGGGLLALIFVLANKR